MSDLKDAINEKHGGTLFYIVQIDRDGDACPIGSGHETIESLREVYKDTEFTPNEYVLGYLIEETTTRYHEFKKP